MNTFSNHLSRRRLVAPPAALAALIIVAAGALLPSAIAQTSTANSAVQQVQIFTTRTDQNRAVDERIATTPEALTGEEAAADADIGEQWMFKPNAPLQPWSAHVDFSGFYTTNAALASSGAQSDRFVVADAGFGYARPIAPDWAFAANVQQGFFRYDEFPALDFDSLTGNVGVSYRARQLGDILFSLNYGINRLTRATFEDQLFLGNSIALNATKLVKPSTADTVEFTGGIGYTFADPHELQRAELRLAVGYALRVTRALTATAMARTELFEYTNDRRDLLQSIAVGARYDFTKWISASASASLAKNISNRNEFDYGVFNGGLTVSAHVQF